MSEDVKDALVDALGRESVKDYLSSCLEGEKEVFDEGFFKRGRGRPRKDDDGAREGLPIEKFARAAMLEERKKLARAKDRLTPGVSEDEKKTISFNADLREIGWDLEELKGSDADFKEMDEELASLRNEAETKAGELREEQELDKAIKAFKELKEDVRLYYGKAKEFLERKDFRRVDEYVSYLKNKPKELGELFDRIEKLFDEACAALCSLADEKVSGGGENNPEAYEVERRGFGMMAGEGYSEYIKRMKSIGMGREIPKTIANVDGIVSGTERRWRSVAGISIEMFDRVKANWQKLMRRIYKSSFVGSCLKVAGVNRILELGLDFGDYDNAYAMLQPTMPFSRKHPAGSQYGGIIVKWKPHAIVATILFGDSLMVGRSGKDYICPSFITSPSPCSFNPNDRELIRKLEDGVPNFDITGLCELLDVPYCEAQLHGDIENYGADAIESIFFSSEYEVCNLSVEALSAIGENMISLYVRGVPIKIEGGKIVKDEDRKEAE